VNTGDGDTALISASDGQLELLRSCHLLYVDAAFRVYGAFVILSAIYGLRPAHRSLVSGDVSSHDPEKTALYQGVFEKLHELLPDFQPSQVIADSEKAPATAIRVIFGDSVTVSGCWFRYSKAMLKRNEINTTIN